MPCISPELLAHVLGQVIAHPPPPLLPMRYRKLRVFSGSTVPAPEEEPFEVWLEQATEIVKEWPVAEAEKKRWLMESLRGPALDLTQSGRRLLGTNGVSLWLWCWLPQPGALGP